MPHETALTRLPAILAVRGPGVRPENAGGGERHAHRASEEKIPGRERQRVMEQRLPRRPSG